MKFRFGYLFLCLFFFTGCEKDQYKYKKFLDNKEIVYAGLAEKPLARSGNLRVQLEWQKSIDPSVVAYIIYWNNNSDSSRVPATAIDTDGSYKYMVTGLPEYVQTFNIVTVDDRGNRSIGQSLNAVRVFGPFYTASLTNQRLNTRRFFGTDSVRLFFLKMDSTKVFSKIRYYKNDGTPDSILFPGDSVTVKSFQPGTKPTVQSYFKPLKTAIDTFKTLQPDSLLAF
jgi:hypothetical protein